ncbi:hypothetical protein Gpo141_00013006 [Globisporangium polare]
MNCQQQPHFVKPALPAHMAHHYSKAYDHRPSPYRKTLLPHDGRRSRARPGKLPMMNNSERGKYYRQKYKEYEDGLEEAAMVLAKQIQDLSLYLHLRDALATQPSVRHCSGAMVAQIFQLVMQADDKRRSSSSSGRHNSSRDASSSLWRRLTLRHHSPLQFEAQAFQISGSGSDSPVVTLQGVLHTKYSPQTFASLHPHISRRAELVQRLADQHVRFPTTLRFYFGSDGALQQYEVDSDLVHGLQSVLRSLDDVSFVLSDRSSEPSQQLTSEHEGEHYAPVQIRIPEPLSPKSEASSGSPMDLGFILS